MLDIKAGDILVVDGKQYPIKACEAWVLTQPGVNALQFGFLMMATLQATVLRNPPMTNGKRGDPQINLANLRCTPLDPVQADIVMRMGLSTPFDVLQTVVADCSGFILLTIEDLKR
jgi:hypothetical protein